MIGITGGSCSGKTRLADAVVRSYPGGEAVAIGLDSYYLDHPPQRTGQTNFDDPKALEKKLLVEQLTMLSRGEPVQKPVYDYTRHRRLSFGGRVRPERLVIVEGLFALYWRAVRSLLAIMIFLELPHAECLRRRVARDTRERGRTPDSVVRQYQQMVQPMYERFVLPTKKFADLVLDGRNSTESLAAAVCDHLRA